MEISTQRSWKWELIPLNFYFKPTLFLFYGMVENYGLTGKGMLKAMQGHRTPRPPRPVRPPSGGTPHECFCVTAVGAGAPVALHVVHLYPYPPTRTYGGAAVAGSPVVLGRPQGGSPPLDVLMSIYGPCLCFPRYRRFLGCGAK